MALLVVICLVLAFVAGVAESTRIIRAVDRAAGELHIRVAALEAKIKEKL